MANSSNRLTVKILLQLLDANEWTQNDLAERSGVNFATVSHHLTGRRPIRDEHLRGYLRPFKPTDRQRIVSAWLRENLDADAVGDILNVTENKIHEGVAGWSPGLDPEQKKMLRWWADQVARDPDLDSVFRGITRKAGWPNPLDATETALLTTDAAGRVVYLNAAFTKISGYSLTQMRGRKPGEVLQGRETEKHIVRNFSKALRERRPFECTITNYHASGAVYRVHIKTFPIFDSLGSLVQYRAIQEKVGSGRHLVLHNEPVSYSAGSEKPNSPRPARKKRTQPGNHPASAQS